MMRITGIGLRSVFHASLRLPGLYSPAEVPGGHAPVLRGPVPVLP